jgi:hypothetical protein
MGGVFVNIMQHAVPQSWEPYMNAAFQLPRLKQPVFFVSMPVHRGMRMLNVGRKPNEPAPDKEGNDNSADHIHSRSASTLGQCRNACNGSDGKSGDQKPIRKMLAPPRDPVRPVRGDQLPPPDFDQIIESQPR